MKPSAADYDLARKIIKTREKNGARNELTEALGGTLVERLLDQLADKQRTPANVLMVAVKLLGDFNLKCQAQPASPEERNRALEASLEGIDLPFPIVSPAKGSTGEH